MAPMIPPGERYQFMTFNAKDMPRSTDYTLFCVSACSAHIPNSLQLYFPSTGEDVTKVNDPELLATVTMTLAKIWDPNWLMVRKRGLEMQMTRPPWRRGPEFGWVNYLAERIGTVDPLPDGWRWSQKQDLPTVFVYERGQPHPCDEVDKEAFSTLSKCVVWKKEGTTIP